jgi:hypothetical protein
MPQLTRRKFVNASIGISAWSLMKGLCMADLNATPLTIVSTHVDADCKPDGDLEKGMWRTAESVSFDQAAFSDVHYPDFKTRVASCWTVKFLYLAFWCPFQSLTIYEGEDTAAERDRLWERDVVEVFIGTDAKQPRRYYEFQVAPNNQWMDIDIDLARTPFNDKGWSSGFEHATRINEANHIWTAEMRIPAEAIGSIHAGFDWRVNFYRCDGPGDDTVRRMMSWGRLPVRIPRGTFHQPDSFGILRFAGAA